MSAKHQREDIASPPLPWPTDPDWAERGSMHPSSCVEYITGLGQIRLPESVPASRVVDGRAVPSSDADVASLAA